MTFSAPFFADVAERLFDGDKEKMEAALNALLYGRGRMMFEVHYHTNGRVKRFSLSDLLPRLEALIRNKAKQKKAYVRNQHIEPKEELYRFLTDYKELDIYSLVGFCRCILASADESQNEGAIADEANEAFKNAYDSADRKPLGGNFYNHAWPAYNDAKIFGRELFTVSVVEGGLFLLHFHDPENPSAEGVLQPAAQAVVS